MTMFTEDDLKKKGFVPDGKGGFMPANNPAKREMMDSLNTAIANRPKQSKYMNKKTEVDGIIFDSKKEASRYTDLKLLLAGGQIKDIQLQKKFDIIINAKHVCYYYADFVYEENKSAAPTINPPIWETVVEDVKSVATKKKEVYRLKKKLMYAALGINIIEV